jgi:ribose-phosphate pyrophosphokinase
MFPLQVMNLIGDVKGKVAVMVDDMIDTAGMPSSMHNFNI